MQNKNVLHLIKHFIKGIKEYLQCVCIFLLVLLDQQQS